MSEINKLLHERLRDWKHSDEEAIVALSEQEAQVLADEIERCYIPIPFDKNGEPWEIGDACIAYGDETTVCGYGKHCAVFVFNEDKSAYNVIHTHFVKRPAPKVLDADGVPINGGDVVYRTTDGLMLKVKDTYHDELCGGCFHSEDGGVGMVASGFTHTKPVFDADGVPIKVGDVVFNIDDNGKRGIVDSIRKSCFNQDELIVLCVDDDGSILFDKYPRNLSHREPDSQEKIDADKKKNYMDYWGCYGDTCEECPVRIYGKKPDDYYEAYSCVVAQGLDIARRQAELDARMGR